jgi:hypothetical protein
MVPALSGGWHLVSLWDKHFEAGPLITSSCHLLGYFLQLIRSFFYPGLPISLCTLCGAYEMVIALD